MNDDGRLRKTFSISDAQKHPFARGVENKLLKLKNKFILIIPLTAGVCLHNLHNNTFRR